MRCATSSVAIPRLAISSGERSSSTYASISGSSSAYGGSDWSSRWSSRSSADGGRSMIEAGISSLPACSLT